MSNKKTSALAPYLDKAIEKKASDIHFNVGLPPVLRVDGVLKPLDEVPLTQESNNQILGDFLGEKLTKLIDETRKELDFTFSYESFRFRTNIFFERGNLTAALRLLPNNIRNFADLGVPQIVERFIGLSQGLIIITGPTGHGKSTTMASMIDKNKKKKKKNTIII